MFNFLSTFRWYRRWKGGTWYYIVDPLSGGGMQSPVTSWVQQLPDLVDILKKEEWPERSGKGPLILSVGLNALLIAGIAFFAGKRLLFQRHLDHHLQAHTYLDNPQYVEQTNLQGYYTKDARIVIFGNSHVYKAHWDELLGRSDVVARGIGSDVTAGYLHRLDQVLRVHPKIVFIEGGANDLYYHYPVDSIIFHLQEIVDNLLAHGITPVLHQLPPFGQQEPTADDYNARVVRLNERIAQLATREHIAYIDLYGDLTKDGYLRPEYCQPDGIHLTALAYVRWASEINKKLQTETQMKGP